MDIKPIETIYNGYRFRSRLEARWAVFFDALDIEYQYEPEGFLLGTFPDEPPIPYLPDFFLPKTKTWVEVKGDEKKIDFTTLAWAVDWGGGLPHTEGSLGSNSGLLLLGNIPENYKCPPLHILLQHNKGGWVNLAFFLPGLVSPIDNHGRTHFDASWHDHLGMGWTEYVRNRLHGQDHIKEVPTHPDVRIAYENARQARFEHGEKGFQ